MSLVGARVRGHCPQCGAQNLHAIRTTDGDFVLTCAAPSCANPKAASQLLADSEIEHVIEFGITGFTVRHPLRERIADDLFNCEVHQDHSRMGYRPVATNGRYRAFKVEGTPYGYGYVLLSDDVAE